MNADQILTDVFADQAELRPDAGDVLAHVQHRLARGHRVTFARVPAVVGTACVVAATAVVAVVISGEGSRVDRQHPTAAAGAAATIPARSVSTISSPAVTQPVVANGYSTIAAGWLPGPARQVGASNQPGFEQRDYEVTVDGVDMDVIIYVESGSQLPSRTEAGSGFRDVTINGHPGREFIATNATIVAFDMGNGTIAYAGPSVVDPTAQVTSARITDIAEHVARDIQFGQRDPIPASEGNQVTRIPR